MSNVKTYQLENVLFVEDATDMHLIVKNALEEICSVQSVGSLTEAKNELTKNQYALLLLDITLPDGNGFEFCQKLREQEEFNELPILFLTGQSDLESRIRGFQVGADDYLMKPFDLRELMVRVQSKLRRVQNQKDPKIISRSGITIDLTLQKVTEVGNTGQSQEILLTPIEFKLLVIFLQNENIVLLRENLIRFIWGEEVHVSHNTLDTHIYSLRKKMGNLGRNIRTVVKQGYCFSS